jgi:hypothetical protein
MWIFRYTSSVFLDLAYLNRLSWGVCMGYNITSVRALHPFSLPQFSFSYCYAATSCHTSHNPDERCNHEACSSREFPYSSIVQLQDTLPVEWHVFLSIRACLLWYGPCSETEMKSAARDKTGAPSTTSFYYVHILQGTQEPENYCLQAYWTRRSTAHIFKDTNITVRLDAWRKSREM